MGEPPPGRLKMFSRGTADTGGTTRPPEGRWWQYVAALTLFALVSLLNLSLQQWIGYQAIALVYLLAIVLFALFAGRGPILLGTIATGLGWTYLFAPPRYSFHVAGFYDKMMFATYFVVALTVGQLTARLRAKHDAEIKLKLLAESERLSRTLLNSVSHELRTPIAAITSAASGLRDSGPLTSDQQKLAAEIELAGGRLNRVVQSLLSAARIQSSQVRPKLDWCDVHDVVRAAIQDSAELAASHPIETKISAHMPLVKMDFVLMEQALANLLANAATHTPAKTPIELTARIEGKQLILEIADRGPGLPPDQLKRIFDLFYRAPTARSGGTGLGLAIVKGFVQAHDGHVQAANRTGGGAIFTIRLPAATAPTLPEETS